MRHISAKEYQRIMLKRGHHDVQDRHPPRRPVPHPGGICTAPPGPTASRSQSDFTPPPPSRSAIAALMTQLLAVEVGRRPQRGGV
jgi:hypothetical protein